MNMVKFRGKGDAGYEMVRDDIEELVLKAEETNTKIVPGMYFLLSEHWIIDN
jgi:hypothetical protein